MGVFSNRTSVDRILYAVFIHENKTGEVLSRLPADTKS